MQTINAFLIALRMAESGGDYGAVNTLNFLGAYQFGEAALVDLGYVRLDDDALDNNYSGGWTGKHGIGSAGEFLASKSVQDRAAEAWVKLMWHYIESENMERYAWTEVGDMQLTPSGMLAATHLLGPYALKEYIRSDGTADLRDPYGMPISSYIDRLAGYDIPFAPEQRPAAAAKAGTEEGS